MKEEMLHPDLTHEATRSLARLLPRLEARYAKTKKRPAGWDDFIRRLHTHFPQLFALYYHLYHGQYDFFYHLEALLNTLAASWLARAAPALGRGAGGEGWVWTTFHRYQWDLNYANPDVFNRMAGEMLFLANVGVEVIRLDAVAFIWKQMGTSCENLPEAHILIQAFNAVARIAALALLFKSEAIVHPADVARYISPEECQLSYNPLLMALLWESLATRSANLLRLSMSERFQINPACAWVNYVRVHDDIGWTFADEDAKPRRGQPARPGLCSATRT
jgi:hypothetical protein